MTSCAHPAKMMMANLWLSKKMTESPTMMSRAHRSMTKILIDRSCRCTRHHRHAWRIGKGSIRIQAIRAKIRRALEHQSASYPAAATATPARRELLRVRTRKGQWQSDVWWYTNDRFLIGSPVIVVMRRHKSRPRVGSQGGAAITPICATSNTTCEPTH